MANNLKQPRRDFKELDARIEKDVSEVERLISSIHFRLEAAEDI